MTFRLLPSMLFAATLTLGAVIAYADAPQELVKAYEAGVAGAKCGLNLDSGASSKLGDAVQRAEQKSGLAQTDLDALWAKTQAEEAAKHDDFCARGAKQADQLLKAK